MAYSYPIWHEISACHYNSKKSWGGKDNSKDSIYVGSSANNSEHFADILITRKVKNGKVIFRLSVDDVILKEAIFDENGNTGRAGIFRKIRTKLKRIKSLK